MRCFPENTDIGVKFIYQRDITLNKLCGNINQHKIIPENHDPLSKQNTDYQIKGMRMRNVYRISRGLCLTAQFSINRITARKNCLMFDLVTSPRFLCRPTAFCSTCWSRVTSERSP
jgi:hypothetical protein